MTSGLGNRRSIQLSYERDGCFDTTRGATRQRGSKEATVCGSVDGRWTALIETVDFDLSRDARFELSVVAYVLR